MAENKLLPFAVTDTGFNLLSQEDYERDAQRFTGNQPGVARSMLVNKALKQSTLVAAAIGEFVAEAASEDEPDVSDLLTPAELAAYLKRTIAGMGGSGLPEGGEPGQALVMNEDGEAAWQDVKAGSGVPVGTIIAFAGTEAPEGFLSINTEKETVVPVEAFTALVQACYCGDEANEEADFFYRAMYADGSVRHPEGPYFVLPVASKYFLRGRDASGEVGAYRYQDWAIENIVGTLGLAGAYARSNSCTGPFYAGASAQAIAAGGSNNGPLSSFDASLAVKTGTETRPMNFPVLWCIKAFDIAINDGELDVQALVNHLDESTVKLADFTGSNQLLSESGYQQFPGGLILQWMKVSVPINAGPTAQFYYSNPGERKAFPVTFPHACLCVSGSMDECINGIEGALTTTDVTTSDCLVYGIVSAKGTATGTIIAIGF